MDGKVIPSGKALILQLDPDDEEAEEAARVALDRRSERDIAKELSAQLDELLPDGASEDVIRSSPQRVTETSDGVESALRRMLQASADLGVKVALDQFENVGLAFDWALANEAARDFAQNHTFELIRGINQTSTAQLQTAIANWVETGDPLSSLTKSLEDTFGRSRARLIAQTETTRVYTEANLISWREAGYGETIPEFQPPLHPSCRCWLVIQVNDDGGASYLYRTNLDSRVCHICSPHHETTVGIARRADEG